MMMEKEYPLKQIQFSAVMVVVLIFSFLSSMVKAEEFDKNAFLEHLQESYDIPFNATVEMGELQPSDIPGFKKAEIHVKLPGKSSENVSNIYLSDDNRHYLWGEFADRLTNADQERIQNVDISNSPVRGNKKAKVVVIEFTDFQCPYCSMAFKFQNKVLNDYKGKIRWVYKSLPLPGHSWAELAAITAECAYLQNKEKFWKLHDAFFENQHSISSMHFSTSTLAETQTRLLELAKQNGLRSKSFQRCVNKIETMPLVQKDLAEASAVKVGGTPGFLVNGHLVSGANEKGLRQRIDEALNGKHGKY